MAGGTVRKLAASMRSSARWLLLSRIIRTKMVLITCIMAGLEIPLKGSRLAAELSEVLYPMISPANWQAPTKILQIKPMVAPSRISFNMASTISGRVWMALAA